MNKTTKQILDEFDKKFHTIQKDGTIWGEDGSFTIPVRGGNQLDVIRDFISKALTEQREEMIKEIKLEKKLDIEKIEELYNDNMSAGQKENYWNMRGISYGYNQAVNDLNDKIKEL